MKYRPFYDYQMAALVRPYFNADPATKNGNPLFRFELDYVAMSRGLQRAAEAFEMDCPKCLRSYQPMRLREGSHSMYFAVTCERDEHRCSKGRKARDAADALASWIRGQPPRPLIQPTLFD